MNFPPDFVSSAWMPRQPRLLRGALAESSLVGTTPADVLAMCRPPVFADINLAPTGSTENSRRRIPQIERAALLYQRYRGEGRNLIFYVFGLGKVDPRFVSLQESVLPAFHHRFLSQLASVADRDSTIELHADLIDTFILQLHGRRHWRVEKPCTDVAYLQYLHDRDSPKAQLVSRGEAELDVVLEPGDALYIPSPWPHGATTCGLDTDSVSLSVGFVALTAARAVRLVAPQLVLSELVAESGPGVLDVLTDADPSVPHGVALAAAAWSRLAPATRARIDQAQLEARLQTFDPVAMARLNLPPDAGTT